MLISIRDYDLTSASRAGGGGAAKFRLGVKREIEIVLPLAQADPVTYDRGGRTVEIFFEVKRTHASIAAAETFAILHERTLPQSGNVQIKSQNGSVVSYVPNGRLLRHDLTEYSGVTTIHAYHIIGGPLSSTPPPPPAFILTEGGDNVLTESGDKIEMEQ